MEWTSIGARFRTWCARSISSAPVACSIGSNRATASPKREALRDVLGLSDANIHYDDEWFNSALVSMGSLGVIYSLIVEVVPQYDLVSDP